MAWAIFTAEFNYSNPKCRHSFNVKPSPEPRQHKEEVVAAAVAAGKARRVE